MMVIDTSCLTTVPHLQDGNNNVMRRGLLGSLATHTVSLHQGGSNGIMRRDLPIILGDGSYEIMRRDLPTVLNSLATPIVSLHH